MIHDNHNLSGSPAWTEVTKVIISLIAEGNYCLRYCELVFAV